MGRSVAQRQVAPAGRQGNEDAGENALARPVLAPEVPILLYMPAFHGGGAENALVRLANHWHDQGRKVTIIVNALRGPVID